MSTGPTLFGGKDDPEPRLDCGTLGWTGTLKSWRWSEAVLRQGVVRSLLLLERVLLPHGMAGIPIREDSKEGLVEL